MKRSEAAKLIADVIGHYDLSTPYEILDALEIAGMAPPIDGHEEIGDDMIATRDWEEEDEE